MRTVGALVVVGSLLVCGGCTRIGSVGSRRNAETGSCTSFSNFATAGATISNGTPYDSTQTAPNAFDGNSSTYSTLVSSATTFIGQDFGSSTPQDILQVVLNGTVDYGFNALLQYSDDNSNWTSTGVIIDVPPNTTTAMTFPVPDSGAHEFWRFLDQGKYAYMEIATVQVDGCAPTTSPPPSPSCASPVNFASAPATISNGTPYDGTQTAPNAFDSDPSTYATLASSATTFIGQDFGSTPQDILQVTLNGTVDFGFNALLQYSDDNSTWTGTGVIIDVPPNTTTAMTLSVPDSGAHEFWRFLDQGKYAFMQIATAQMLGCSSCTSFSSNLATPTATISNGTPYDGSQTAPNAFDGSLSTYSTLVSSATTFIGQDFGAASTSIRQIMLNGTVDYGFNALLQFSDDNSTWTGTGIIMDVPPNTTTAMTVNVGDQGPHRYWRFLDQGKYKFMEIAEVGLYACGSGPSCSSFVDVTSVAATISNGTPYDDTQTAPNAFDGDPSTYSTLVSSATTFIGQDFGATPEAISQVVLNGTVSYGFNAALQYSDDNSTWTGTGLIVDVPPGTTTPMTATVPASGTHRYWRFLDKGKYAFMEIATVQMEVCGPAAFLKAVNYSAGTSPQFVIIHDFDGKNGPELAVASDQVYIFVNNGDGTFPTPAPYPVGQDPLALVAGDFNGDTKDDIAVVNSTDGTVSILLGVGDATFTTASSPAPVGDTPVSIAAGDFDNDNNLDLVVANLFSNNVSVLFGRGDGTFDPAVSLLIDTSGTDSEPEGVIVADFNHDGRPDIATANSQTAQVSVLINNGARTFNAFVKSDVGTGSVPTALAAADFDGDSKLDLVVANGNLPSDVRIMLGNGSGGFGAATPYSCGSVPVSVAVSDFNQDGTLDVVTANAQDNNASVLIGLGGATFAAAANFATDSAPLCVAAGDLNQDGKPDLAVANSQTSTSHDVSVLINNF